jgi:hypothetical protein
MESLFLGIIAVALSVLAWKALTKTEKKAGKKASKTFISWVGGKMTTLGTKMSGEQKLEKKSEKKTTASKK